jgi:hypothetical protein
MEQLNMEQKPDEVSQSQQQTTGIKQEVSGHHHGRRQEQGQSNEYEQNLEITNTLELLLTPERNDNYLPYQLLKKKRKKTTRYKRLQ